MSTYPSQQYFHPCILPLERAFIIGHRGELLALCDIYVNVHSVFQKCGPHDCQHTCLSWVFSMWPLCCRVVQSVSLWGKLEFSLFTRQERGTGSWCLGNHSGAGESSLLSPCSAPGSCVTMYHPELLLFQGTSVSEIGKLLYQSPILARLLHSVSSCC